MLKKFRKPLVSLLVLVPALLQAQPPVPDSPAIERQVDTLMGKLSLREKIVLLGGEDDMFTHAEPEIGLPRLKMSDGPVGVRTWGPSTAYAAGIALAASWDPALAERLGKALGQDARARGANFLLGPAVNIYRAPMNGRNFEYLGEDPYLASRLAVSYIEGVQSEGVAATVKHFAANNSEFDRHNLNVVIDERTLREIYLPAFEAAVTEGHAGAVMDSYNLVNGEHSTQNRHLNVDILKKDWGFNGILMSDWEATYDGVAAANAGLDLEMPSAEFMNAKTLIPAIQQGKVPPAVIDDKVRRILRTAIRFGFLNHEQTELGIPLYSQADRQVALDGARESIVLLKNQGRLLPLDLAKVRSIAVIGPDAWPPVTGGGSSEVTPFAATGILTGMSDLLGSRVKVFYARGLPSLSDLCQETVFHGELKQETFDNANFSGTPTSTEMVHSIDHFTEEMWGAPSARPRSVRWSGSYLPAKPGKYVFVVAATGEDAYRLLVGGKVLIEETRHEGQAPHSSELTLQAGKAISLELDYQPYSTDHISFGIRAAADLVAPEARALAAKADVALVAVGFDPVSESEGFDRSFTLPWGQDSLIQSIAAANPKTIVTVTAGGGVAMEGWIDRVTAVVDTWYPGQEGGRALAEILMGERSPEGKLPASFEKTWEENPVHDHYYPPPAQPGQPPTVHYAEGVFLGYRYYTTRHIEPLFPFGFGLSYTTFSFSNLKISPRQVTAGSPVIVSFDVTNTGKRAGAEVAQLYVGDPSAQIQRPVKELKGFEKVRLNPGQSAHVVLTLDSRALSYWSDKNDGWQIDPGRFLVFAGDSSENTPLSSGFVVEQAKK